MTSFNGRRGVNVSQFLANGNTIPSPNDVASPEDNDFRDFEKDLARFTNVDFTQVDYDNGGLFNVGHEGQAHLDFESNPEESLNKQKDEVLQEGKGLDFVDGGYSFPGTNPFDLPASPSALPPPASLPEYTTTSSQISSTLPTAFSGYPSHQQSFTPEVYPGAKRPVSSISTSNPFSSALPPAGSSPTDDNPLARHAAEEDKRRRNTAASARFRVKKKQREQALEKTAEELKSRAQELEAKVGQLQKENEWLRGLVVVRGDVAKGKANAVGEEAKRILEESERIPQSEARKGVGTKSEEEEAGDG